MKRHFVGYCDTSIYYTYLMKWNKKNDYSIRSIKNNYF